MAGLPQEGQSFGRYDIVRRIGRGGMGVVYAAVQQGLGRQVALKVLSADLADNEDYRSRFLREAEVLARLDSPHIIQVHDAGEHEGWLYIATQLVPDGDLHQFLGTNGALPDAVALDLVGQVADGIDAAHSAGIIHRDIKPSNVLLRRRPDGSHHAYVCDLGISRMLDSQHTRTQGVVGTFTYMAPERHEGHDATEASDVYALGCVLWATLSGSAPYVGTDGQVLMGHLSGPIPQLERTDPAARRINEILQRSMAKNPADRYPSAHDLAAACRAVSAPVSPDEAPTRLPGGTPGAQQSQAPQQSTGPQHSTGPQPASGPQPAAWAHSGTGPQPSDQPTYQSPQQWSTPSGPQHASYGTTGQPPGPAPGRGGGNRLPWILAGVAALVLVGGIIIAAIATGGDDKDDDKDGGGDLAADVPADADLEEFCDHYNNSPERDLESVRAYAKTMKEMGTPEEMPKEAREGFLWQIELVEEVDEYDEFTDAVQNMSDEHRQQVTTLDTWAKSNCL